jgi:transposase InsO family protein
MPININSRLVRSMSSELLDISRWYSLSNENRYVESFNRKMRDEVLSREVFDTLLEAKVLVERWRREYNHIRPHSSLGYRPPALEVIIPMSA